MHSIDWIIKENINKHNLNWPQIHDHLYRILIIGRSGSGKTLFNLIIIINNHQNVGKKFLYAKDPYEEKYQFFLNKQEILCLKHLNGCKAFNEYSNDKDGIYDGIWIAFKNKSK